MARNNTSERFPSWLPAIAGAVILCIIAGLLVIMFRDHTAPVTPQQVEKQFAEHLAFLKELAYDCPAARLTALSELSSEENSEEIVKVHEAYSAWSDRSDARPDLISHPALLGISITGFSPQGGTRIAMQLKKTEGLEPSWFDDLSGCLGSASGEPELDQAVTRLWRTSEKEVIEYENRFLEPQGMKMGIKLHIDMKQFDTPPPPQSK